MLKFPFLIFTKRNKCMLILKTAIGTMPKSGWAEQPRMSSLRLNRCAGLDQRPVQVRGKLIEGLRTE